MATIAQTPDRENTDRLAVYVPQHDELTDLQRLGGLLAASGYFADAREMAQAAVKVMAGKELGIPPMAAMMGISIIKGKVALGGNLIASRIRAHGYDYRHKQFDAAGCILEFWSKPDREGKRTLMGESSFVEQDAKAAGVYGEMYKKYPRNMYFNRAISNGAKWYCPEVFAGSPVYCAEELGATVDQNGNAVISDPPAKSPSEFEKYREQRIAEAEAKLAEEKPKRNGRTAAQPIPMPPPATPENPGPVADTTLDIPPEVQALYARMLPASENAIRGVINGLRDQLVTLLDSHGADIYDRIMATHDLQNNRKLAVAKAVVFDLWKAVRQAEMLNTADFHATDDDIPGLHPENGKPAAAGGN